MRPEPKKRIETQSEQAPLAGMEAAFGGLTVPAAPETVAPSVQPTPPPLAWRLGRVVLRRERAHRGGKTVIVIGDFATHLPLSVIETTARKVRAVCGCGGTVKDRQIEIQGNQPSKVRAALEAEGFTVAGVK